MSQNPFQHLLEEEMTLPVTKFTVRYRKPTTDEGFAMTKLESLPTDEKLEKSVAYIVTLIVSWTAKDKDGNPVPVNRESFGYLPSDDSTALMKRIGGKEDDDPKAAS